ncbi:MAG: UvrD-helicase domain-containing protein [Myxococcota bacterium]|nr:UvrD-helicase domain-containing protein [Myxococcota bacterium]
MLDLENDLNERQLEAVRQVDGPVLVIAGAGSGKTRVITYRVAHLVAHCGVAPWRILAVTFTNKAAREMRQRIGGLLLGRGQDCWVATFHATCAKLLRLHADLARVDKNFTIYDDGDQKAMVARCLKALNIDDKKFPARAVQSEINRAKREFISADAYPRDNLYQEQIQRVYALYEAQMQKAAALDFADLLFRMVRGMQENEDLLQAVSERFDYILADEFQDTNRVQLEFIRLLAQRHGNICVVGDDDQSIYSWRGANVENILGFETHFPSAFVVTMDRNYRSTSNILNAAHGVVAELPNRRPKTLWTSIEAGDPIGFIEAEDERDEARLVAKAVAELRDDGFPLNAQAVFYRINAQSRVFEEVFRTMDIPHRVVGGMRFYERAEIKDILSYLRLIHNTADLAAFLRVVNKPARGIGKTTVDRLIAVAAEAGISAFEAIDRASGSANIGSAGIKRLRAFRDLVVSWCAEISAGPLHLIGRILEDTGYLEALKLENTAEADARMENLNELIGSVEDFQQEAEDPSLSAFLELIALQTDVDTADFDSDAVTLMTVHAAKGLEFDVVHLTGLEEDLFPYQRSGDSFTSARAEEMDEERRLCYVAMTRARKRLLLNCARSRRLFGRTRYNPVSRFLINVPQDVMVDLTPDRPNIRPVEPFGISAPQKEPSWSPSRDTSNHTWVDRSFDQSLETSGLCPGQKVRNAKFGVGKVVAVRPGPRPKVDVMFPGYGKKTIMADFLEADV